MINLGIKVKGTKMKQENIRADNCTSKALPWLRLVHIQHQVLVSISHKEPHLCVIQQELTRVNLWWTEILQKSIWEDSVISKKDEDIWFYNRVILLHHSHTVEVNKRQHSFTQTLEEILFPIFYVTILIILLVIW